METIHCRAEDEEFKSIDNVLFTRRPKRRRALSSAERKKQLETAFLQPPKEIPEKLVERTQQRWDLEVDKSLLFEIDAPDIGTQTLFYRGGRNFQIIAYEEVAAPRDIGGDNQDINPNAALSIGSGSANGAGADAEEQWLQKSILARESTRTDASGLQRIVQAGSGGLLAVAPGLQRGIRFSDERPRPKPKPGKMPIHDADTTKEIEGDLERSSVEDDAAAIETGAADGSNNTTRAENNVDDKDVDGDADESIARFDADVDELLPVEFPSLQTSEPLGSMVAKKSRREWAHMVDLEAESSNFRSLIPGQMAREWPFELDPFQKEAIYHLESGDSVFVAAHTSAGKTVVAEYAIALAQKHQTKAIYTSPIKALSNQKFRDFKTIFDDVGILTGDVQINQEAKCLIMTTEILRSKLYSQSDLLREVEFVIFDEVHYVSDSERGVVWEEVIIMLPEQVSLILLSATVPNTYEFASWVGRTKKRDVYVINTPKRPVPLEHYLWSGKTIQKIVDSDRKWVEKGYREAKMIASGETTTGGGGSTGGGSSSARGIPIRGGNSQQRGGSGRGGGGRGGRGGNARGGGNGPPRASHNPGHMGRAGRATGGSSIAQEKTLWLDVVRYLRKASLLPACIFVFSRTRCEEYAMSLSNLDFCDAGEKTRIHSIYAKSIARLTKEDQELPQITRLRDMATRGIAVHHGGLLPIVKEIVELLFAQSLVKVLFATETFAVGLNLPTRTVVFSDHRKFDGTRRRILSPGEYTQMAGRAGRRGLDTVGTAIIVSTSENRDIPAAETLKGLILGQPTRLTSQFRLTYNMILSLHRVETLKVEDMMKRSFSEHATQNGRSEDEEQIRLLEKDLAAQVQSREVCEACGNTMGSCHLAAETYRQDTAQMYQKLLKTPVIGPSVFCQGRVAVFVNEQGVHAIGVITDGLSTLAMESETPSVGMAEVVPPRMAPDETDKLSFVPPLRGYWRPAVAPGASKLRMRRVQVPLGKIEHLSHHVVSIGRRPDELLTDIEAQLTGLDLSWSSAVWDEVSLEKVRDVDVVWYMDDRVAKARAVAESPALDCPNFVEHYAARHDEWLIRDKLADMRRAVDDSNLALLPEYQSRIAVLKHLGFVNDSSVVLLKGRVACEIRTADELVLTEVILNNLLAGLEPAEIAALLSIFVYQGKDDQELETAPFISNGLTKSLSEVYRIWKDVIRTQEQLHVISAGDDSERSSKLHFGLMEVVYEWASGSPFKTIAGMTAEQEGTIVRTITRLEETSREVRNIGRIVGDTTLETKMNGVKESIMRNITTVPSLYL
ncbi:antiviral helicase SKI2 [Sporothrix schenckii 1099-18]|uniref:Antiviral helicase SKI2 n=1 Tax=Sporothrix schenckii 1099-18 TaxID=1397361 RepID=A0A0F2M2H8_SPOSC|nr:antiviral helicase SKI2 [Sporothrix schenckii 1099-18]KJR83309.1 antiviral helicase SKI2 [Sporothrix schenckii 1099-18]